MSSQLALFEGLPEPPQAGSRIVIKLKALNSPVWTANKAQLIERYLRYFVYVTKHGTYIDGFAGPQEPDAPDSWSAKRVLDSEPRRLRHYFLCELDPKKVAMIQKMVDEQRPIRKGDPKRSIKIYCQDFNVAVDDVLASGIVTAKEATFCLLDQRTFECDWATVEKLARHKTEGAKIELFYFLAAAWFDRAANSKKDEGEIEKWWGRSDFRTLTMLKDHQRVDLLCERFRDELGYKTAMAWPIYSRTDGGRIKYFMVHASDHEEAYKLMWRAYHNAVGHAAPADQTDWIAKLATLPPKLAGAAP